MGSISIIVTVTDPPRGGGHQTPLTFHAQAKEIANAWGSQPAQAIITAVSQESLDTPILTNSMMKIKAGGHIFWGICRSNPGTSGTGGRKRTLEFLDMRYWLNQDDVFGQFNQVEMQQTATGRVKRYYHIYPEDWRWGIKTYTDEPLSAANIIYRLLNAPTVKSPWYNAVSPVIYHTDQISERFHHAIDCMSGKKLGAVLQEVAEKQGLLYTLLPQEDNPYLLWFARKGEGVLPTWTVNGQPSIFPPNSDQKRDGYALSGAPDLVRVIGEPNLYQAMNLTMTPDWNGNYNPFFDPEKFAVYVYENLSTAYEIPGVAAGTRYKEVLDDPDNPATNENYVGQQLAFARARTITVREFAALHELVNYADHRMFNGRSRMDMPVWLYIQQLLYRAWRPPEQIRLGGAMRPLRSLQISSQMVAKVEHDPLTGVMSANRDEQAAGNGYAVVQGYNLGPEFFEALQPERFNLAKWLNEEAVWRQVPFQIDDSGEDGGFILFESQIYRPGTLLKVINGYVVQNADGLPEVPPVRATLSFEAERFLWTEGNGIIAHAENVSGLRAEIVNLGTSEFEVPYTDGQTASEKARDIALSLLKRAANYRSGGFIHYMQEGDEPIRLHPMYDRVNIRWSPEGLVEDVDFTTERQSDAFVPERDFDRWNRERQLLPGQAELQQQAKMFKLAAVGLRLLPEFRAELSQTAETQLGIPRRQTRQVWLRPNPTAPPVTAGSVVVMQPPVLGTAVNRQTTAGCGQNVTDKHTVFGGIAVRDGEKAGRVIRVVQQGPVLAQVALDARWPLKAGTELVWVPGTEGANPGEVVASTTLYAFYGDSRSQIVATLMEDLPQIPEGGEAEFKLARVHLGRPVPVPRFEARVVEVGNYVLRVEAVYDGTVYLVLKPSNLFTPPSAGGYERVSTTERKVLYPGTSEQTVEMIFPSYMAEYYGEGTIIVQRLEAYNSYYYAIKEAILEDDIDVVTGLEEQVPPVWYDSNWGARQWRPKEV